VAAGHTVCPFLRRRVEHLGSLEGLELWQCNCYSGPVFIASRSKRTMPRAQKSRLKKVKLFPTIAWQRSVRQEHASSQLKRCGRDKRITQDVAVWLTASLRRRTRRST
jgi:hypothetical protein